MPHGLLPVAVSSDTKLSEKTDEKKSEKTWCQRSLQKEIVGLVFAVLHSLRNTDGETVPQSYDPVLTDHSRTALNKLFMTCNSMDGEVYLRLSCSYYEEDCQSER